MMPASVLQVKPTVLVVDDEEDLRDLAEIILIEFGCAVLKAASGEDALRILEGDFLRIDLLFSDVMMPGMSGFGLAKRAQEVRPGLRVLLTSAYVDPQLAAAMSDGYWRILPKPYRAAQLIAAIRAEFEQAALRATQAGMPSGEAATSPEALENRIIPQVRSGR
jgi:DNA-binding NtrC family response regulator